MSYLDRNYTDSSQSCLYCTGCNRLVGSSFADRADSFAVHRELRKVCDRWLAVEMLAARKTSFAAILDLVCLKIKVIIKHYYKTLR